MCYSNEFILFSSGHSPDRSVTPIPADETFSDFEGESLAEPNDAMDGERREDARNEDS